MRTKSLFELFLVTGFISVIAASVLAQCPPNCPKLSPSKISKPQRIPTSSIEEYKKLARGYSIAVQKGSELQVTLSERQKQFKDKLKETGKKLLDKIIDEGADELTKDDRTRSNKSKSNAKWKPYVKALNEAYQRVNDYNDLLDDIINTAGSLVDLQGDTAELELKLGRLDTKLQKLKMEDKNNSNQKHSSNEYKQLTREYLETVKEVSLLNAKINDKQAEFGQRMGMPQKSY